MICSSDMAVNQIVVVNEMLYHASHCNVVFYIRGGGGELNSIVVHWLGKQIVGRKFDTQTYELVSLNIITAIWELNCK